MNLLQTHFKDNLTFEKWHGAGNDFLFLRATDLRAALKNKQPDLLADSMSALAHDLCQRTTGLGADGLVVWQVDELQQHVSAGIWNSDGSRAQTCGNALRCFAGLLLSKNLWNGRAKQAVHALQLSDSEGSSPAVCFATLLAADQQSSPGAFQASVAMGHVREFRENLRQQLHPLLQENVGTLWHRWVEAVSFVQLANPHLVLQLRPGAFNQLSVADFSSAGLYLQTDGVCRQLSVPLSNIGFVELSENQAQHPLNAIVFERGAGLTQCCGSGGCAMRVALQAHKPERSAEKIQLRMPGGVIAISVDGPELVLTGPAQCIAHLSAQIGAALPEQTTGSI